MRPAHPSLQPCTELPDLCNNPFGRQSLWTYGIFAIVWFMLMQELMETRTGVTAILFGKPTVELAVPDTAIWLWHRSFS